MTTTRFNLGDKLRDKITGFEGVAMSRFAYISGTVQYSLQPDKLDDKGQPRDSSSFDWQRLEFVTGATHSPTTNRDLPTFDMGDFVADTVTELTGTITVRAEFIDGCVHYGVQPADLTKRGEIVKPYLIDCQRLRLMHKAQPMERAAAGGPQEIPRPA